MYRFIHKIWYEGSRWYLLFMPLSLLFWTVSSVRRALYRNGILSKTDVGVPVIVVGNITAGGTGKTPITIWLAQQLAERGYRPGVVSRGYAGSGGKSPLRVDAASDPAVVGDEPVLIARRAACPVIIGADRGRAARMLVDDGVDVVIADDGLQHYALHRAYEICVIDGERRLGNRRLLPAGPLRETARRLLSVDQVLVNGQCGGADTTVAEQNALCFELRATHVCRADEAEQRPLESFAGEAVHAVAAIGNPDRFFDLLRRHGIEPVEHPLRDHDTVNLQQLNAGSAVIMTEKDVVKLEPPLPGNAWYVPVSVFIDPVKAGAWLEQMHSRLKDEQRRHA